MNLLHEGPYEIADRIRVRLRASHASLRVWVAPDGAVTVAEARAKWKRTPEPPEQDLIGTYTPSAGGQVVRGDLEARLAEIRQDIAA